MMILRICCFAFFATLAKIGGATAVWVAAGLCVAVYLWRERRKARQD